MLSLAEFHAQKPKPGGGKGKATASTIMVQFFSNIFPWMGKVEEEEECAALGGKQEEQQQTSPAVVRKRVLLRTTTPALIMSTGKRQTEDASDNDDADLIRPVKIFRGEHRNVHLRPVKERVSPLEALPEDVVANCLSFLGGVEDRFALQCTSKQFLRVSITDAMLIGVSVGGDPVTGKNGLLLEDDTPISAAEKLTPYCMAGNLEALYM